MWAHPWEEGFCPRCLRGNNTILRSGCKIEIRLARQLKSQPNVKETVLIFKSRMLDVISEEEIVISMPTQAGKIILFPVDEEFEVLYFTNSGIYRSYNRVSFRRREGLSCRPRSRIPAPASPPGPPTCLKQLTLSRGFIVRLFLNHARYKTKSSPFWLHEPPPLTWPCPTVSSASPSRREADVPPVIFPDLFLGSIPPL